MKTGPVTTMVAVCGYIFLLSPLVIVAILSFSSGPYLSFPPPGFSLRWYQALLANDAILHAAGVSALLAAIVTVVAVILGFPAALAVARRRVSPAASALLSLPLLMPTLVIGLALLFVLQPLGLLATWPGIALGHLVVVLPFVVRIMQTSLAALPADIESAAATLGPAVRHLPAHHPAYGRPRRPRRRHPGLSAVLRRNRDQPLPRRPQTHDSPVALFHYTESRADPLVAALAVALIVFSVILVLAVDRLIGVTRSLG